MNNRLSEVDRVLFVFVCTAMTIGLIFSYSLSTYISFVTNQSQFQFFAVQLLSITISIILMWGISLLDPNKFLDIIGVSTFVIFFLLMIFMPFMPNFLVPQINGAKRWIKLFGFSLSAVEFFKIGFVYFLAWSFSRKFYVRENLYKKIPLKEELKLFMPYLGVFVVVIFLIVVMQNDLGQGIILVSTMLTMIAFAGSSFRLFITLLLGGMIGVVSFLAYSSYRLTKVKQWWLGFQDFVLSFMPDYVASKLRVESSLINEAFQVNQSINAIHNGGIFGVGLGNGVFKLGFVSDVHTDFVFAGIIEELGFIGALFVIFVLVIIMLRILKIANRNTNPVFYLFGVGIACVIFFQFLMNTFGIVGLAPVKGVTLPFISYGGSSIIAFGLAMGMVLSSSKVSKK
jgi:cell division protein FtsW